MSTGIAILIHFTIGLIVASIVEALDPTDEREDASTVLGVIFILEIALWPALIILYVLYGILWLATAWLKVIRGIKK